MYRLNIINSEDKLEYKDLELLVSMKPEQVSGIWFIMAKFKDLTNGYYCCYEGVISEHETEQQALEHIKELEKGYEAYFSGKEDLEIRKELTNYVNCIKKTGSLEDYEGAKRQFKTIQQRFNYPNLKENHDLISKLYNNLANRVGV